MNIHQGDFMCLQTNFLNGKFMRVPDVVQGDFYAGRARGLTSLENGPSRVSGYYSCSQNNVTSLSGAKVNVGLEFYCYENQLTELHDVHKHVLSCSVFDCTINKIKHNILGLLLINGLTQVDGDSPAFRIIQKWLGQGKSAIFRCQKDLIDKGFEEYAKL